MKLSTPGLELFITAQFFAVAQFALTSFNSPIVCRLGTLSGWAFIVMIAFATVCVTGNTK